MSTRPFVIPENSLVSREIAVASRLVSYCPTVTDYPGRVQVKEGNYTGGGAKSSFVGRSDGNLGMAMPAWAVRNTDPFQK